MGNELQEESREWPQCAGKGQGIVIYVLIVASGQMVVSVITIQQKWHFQLDLGYEREVQCQHICTKNHLGQEKRSRYRDMVTWIPGYKTPGVHL